ncbi:MAG: helix-hairpin-helix domain-containing protein [Firmicutes bacterium]|nr:helix-hairpin-helix domain-containing protein [Bacillota bacterium]
MKLSKWEKAAIAAALVFVLLIVGYFIGSSRLGGGFTVASAKTQEAVSPLLPSATPSTRALPSPSAAPTPPPTPHFPIDLNTATADELDALPKIGPALAERIIAYRQENGNFASIEDVKNVKGIGDAIFADIKDLITVSADTVNSPDVSTSPTDSTPTGG